MACTRHLALSVPATVTLVYGVVLLLVSQGQAEQLPWVTVASFNGTAAASNVWRYTDSYQLNGQTQTSFCAVEPPAAGRRGSPCMQNPSWHAPPPLAGFAKVDLGAAFLAMQPFGGAAAALVMATALTFFLGVCPTLRMAPPGRTEGSPTTASLVVGVVALGVAAAACEGAFMGTFDALVYSPLLANATAFTAGSTTPAPPAAGAPPYFLSPGPAQSVCIAAIALAVAPSVSGGAAGERGRAFARARTRRGTQFRAVAHHTRPRIGGAQRPLARRLACERAH